VIGVEPELTRFTRLIDCLGRIAPRLAVLVVAVATAIVVAIPGAIVIAIVMTTAPTIVVPIVVTTAMSTVNVPLVV